MAENFNRARNSGSPHIRESLSSLSFHIRESGGFSFGELRSAISLNAIAESVDVQRTFKSAPGNGDDTFVSFFQESIYNNPLGYEQEIFPLPSFSTSICNFLAMFLSPPFSRNFSISLTTICHFLNIPPFLLCLKFYPSLSLLVLLRVFIVSFLHHFPTDNFLSTLSLSLIYSNFPFVDVEIGKFWKFPRFSSTCRPSWNFFQHSCEENRRNQHVKKCFQVPHQREDSNRLLFLSFQWQPSTLSPSPSSSYRSSSLSVFVYLVSFGSREQRHRYYYYFIRVGIAHTLEKQERICRCKEG